MLALLLASCVTMVGCQTETAIVKTDFCSGWKPITVSRSDTLSDSTSKQILAHDLHGVDMGCWAKPRASKKPVTSNPAAASSAHL